MVLREQSFRAMLSLLEHARDLRVHDRSRQASENSVPNFVLNAVANDRSHLPASLFRDEFVAVMPLLEWAFYLGVSEINVLLEFQNARQPPRSEWQQPNHAKRNFDLRTRSGNNLSPGTGQITR